MIKMEPQPEWEEEPAKTEEGFWVGRYRYLRQGFNGEPEVDIDVWEAKPPENIPNAEPKEIDKVWYWVGV